MSAATQHVVELDRGSVQRFLPQLDEWLLGDSPYGVQHTWPQLYRSDGDGRFFAVVDGDRLLSHCALRTAALVDGRTAHRIALLGSVATAPAARGRGLAGQVLEAALAALPADVTDALLWAEQPGLYAARGLPVRREGTYAARRWYLVRRERYV